MGKYWEFHLGQESETTGRTVGGSIANIDWVKWVQNKHVDRHVKKILDEPSARWENMRTL
ncbi:MAG: hypothetical protein SFZ03_00505 [Candidatus Melainabacteria bacterium]|nr:hypothetical protein [Candidatus Melainabacteria bacterium]